MTQYFEFDIAGHTLARWSDGTVSRYRWGYISNGDAHGARPAIAAMRDGKFVDHSSGEEYCPIYPDAPGMTANGIPGQLYIGVVVPKPLDPLSVSCKYKGEFVEIKEDYDGRGNTVFKRRKGDRWYKVLARDLEYPKEVLVFVKSAPINIDESVSPRSAEVYFSGYECESSTSSGSSGGSYSYTVEFVGPRLYDRDKFVSSHFCGMSTLTEEFRLRLTYDEKVWSIIFDPGNYEVEFAEDRYEGGVSISHARMKKDAHEKLDAALDACAKSFDGKKYTLPTIQITNE
jgi:hypothetical protein